VDPGHEVRGAPAFALGALVLASAAACGDGATGAGDPFAKPSPTVAVRHEGLDAEGWAARLSDRDPAARAEAVLALASLGAAGAERADAMVPLLADPVASVRFAAVMAAQRLDGAPAPLVDAAVARMDDPDDGVRRLARDAARQLGAAAAPGLRRHLRAEDAALRRAALAALASTGETL
jgi:hypothetical protein